MPDRYRCLVVLAGFVGLRLGELLGLERRHVNFLHATLTVAQQQQELSKGQVVIGPPKSAAGVRTIALPAFVIPELERHLDRFATAARQPAAGGDRPRTNHPAAATGASLPTW